MELVKLIGIIGHRHEAEDELLVISGGWDGDDDPTLTRRVPRQLSDLVTDLPEGRPDRNLERIVAPHVADFVIPAQTLGDDLRVDAARVAGVRLKRDDRSIGLHSPVEIEPVGPSLADEPRGVLCGVRRHRASDLRRLTRGEDAPVEASPVHHLFAHRSDGEVTGVDVQECRRRGVDVEERLHEDDLAIPRLERRDLRLEVRHDLGRFLTDAGLDSVDLLEDRLAEILLLDHHDAQTARRTRTTDDHTAISLEDALGLQSDVVPAQHVLGVGDRNPQLLADMLEHGLVVEPGHEPLSNPILTDARDRHADLMGQVEDARLGDERIEHMAPGLRQLTQLGEASLASEQVFGELERD